ncbi:hypothetical protein [Ornithinimicrobium pekingense]|uniref:Uncharacterized protein n=1 Tax=Ornithinimicrobium pekingense TaxID=384677 RepID=A0ABQ2F5V3_9MICO|nr:hypothetical protein [Ornithinimicrobium pekingense]GGK64134.1 hypothetical protein GCM10011509_10690 [Ornithinimicrobium pekingense]
MSKKDTVRGFAVLQEDPGGRLAAWHVGYGPRIASNVNAIVLPKGSPNIDNLCRDQFVLSADGQAQGPSAKEVCESFIEGSHRLGEYKDIPHPRIPSPPQSNISSHVALAAANDLVASWNYWIKTVRRVTSAKDPHPLPVIPTEVCRIFRTDPEAIKVVGAWNFPKN